MPLGCPPEADPGDLIADRKVRELYHRFLDAICGIHDEIKLRTMRLESRVYLGDILLCRVVPYRELFHVQVGAKNPWEIRVREAASCFDTLDGVLAEFLDVYVCRKCGQSDAG
jgi:hypothetical protein